jgi:hypothetical protein
MVFSGWMEKRSGFVRTTAQRNNTGLKSNAMYNPVLTYHNFPWDFNKK